MIQHNSMLQTKEAVKKELSEILPTLKWKVTRVTSPAYCFLAFHLNRETMYRNLLTSLWMTNVLLTDSSIGIHKGNVVLNFGTQSDATPTTDDLRGVILFQHIYKLLICCG